jgi:hypothetical protein
VRRFTLPEVNGQVSGGVIPKAPRKDLCLRFVGFTGL